MVMAAATGEVAKVEEALVAVRVVEAKEAVVMAGVTVGLTEEVVRVGDAMAAAMVVGVMVAVAAAVARAVEALVVVAMAVVVMALAVMVVTLEEEKEVVETLAGS